MILEEKKAEDVGADQGRTSIIQEARLVSTYPKCAASIPERRNQDALRLLLAHRAPALPNCLLPDAALQPLRPQL